MVIVDTCILSEALRRTQPNPDIANKLADLIKNDEVVVIESIRQDCFQVFPMKRNFKL